LRAGSFNLRIVTRRADQQVGGASKVEVGDRQAGGTAASEALRIVADFSK
jgi:hypothetical protein